MINSELELGVEEVSYYYQEMLRGNLLELEVETPKGKLVLKRATERVEPAAVHVPPPARRRAAAPVEKEAKAAAHPSIKSPINGVFYRSASPQSPSFIKEGDTVNPGTTLCIVEAMKVMNEIKSDSRCRIVKIMVENGKPVSKGQDLFHIEPV